MELTVKLINLKSSFQLSRLLKWSTNGQFVLDSSFIGWELFDRLCASMLYAAAILFNSLFHSLIHSFTA